MEEDKLSFPNVSVIVPVYNGARTIAACLESLLEQNYPKNLYEVIVVDNKSSDSTAKIVQSYPVKLLFEREIQTSYAARHRGILESKGEIIACIDADCMADPNWLSELVQPFKDESVGAAGGAVKDAPPTSLVEKVIGENHPYQNCQRFEGKFIQVLLGLNMAFPKSLYLELGGFRANLYTIGDIDFGWRLQIELKKRLVFVPGAVVYHRHRTTIKGMFKQKHRAGFGRILQDTMYRVYADYPYPPPVELKTIGKQFFYLMIYTKSLAYRLLTYKIRGKDWDYAVSPAVYFVGETGSILGKLKGLWVTRFFQRDPSGLLLQDPLER